MNILISTEEIDKRVKELAEEITRDYQGQSLTIIGILTGSLMFVADLIRQLPIPLKLGFIQASSYRGSATEPGKLEVYEGLLPDICDRNVLLVDDILDTGQTLAHLVQVMHSMGVSSLRTGVLLKKIGRQIHEMNPDYCGFEIPDKFVIGYGLDFNDEYRNLPYIAVWEENEG